MNNHAPLTNMDIERATTVALTKGDDAGELVAPVPADAPVQPSIHYRHGNSAKTWKYLDEMGALLFEVHRFESKGGGKEVLPLTLWRDARGRLEWRWKGYHSPRPLYNLDKLAENPEAPVVVVEGEKTADAAARIFPKSIATTSPGGAHGAGKADWSPLAGRKVLIWPDADKPGDGYASAVAKILAALGCTVSIIDSMSLGAMAPDGTEREVEPGWDAADAVDEWADLFALRKAANGLAKLFTTDVNGDGPLPLYPPLPRSTPYPLEAMGCLQAVVEAIERKVQVPASTAAQSVLAVTALAAQAHANVVLPYGQKRPLSLFLATIAGSGDRKSSADNEASWPVAKREKALHEAHREEVKKWKINHAAWQAEKKKIETDRKLGFDGRADELATLGPEPLPPLSPFLSMSDLTLDGLTKNWLHAHPSLAIFTAEGATFTGGHGMSEENRLRTAASLSEVWDGKPIKRVRALDGVTILRGRRLSLHVMIQPDASHGFLASPVLRDQGLLSRILVAAPESIAGSRLYCNPDPSDDAAIGAFGVRILSILEAPAPVVDGRNELEPRDLPMSAEATALWVEFFDHVEGQSDPNGQLAGLRDFASKAAEHVARIAGVLTIARDLKAEAIKHPDMENAIGLMNWYLGEAERLQSASRLDPRLLRAAALLEWMQAQGADKIQFRDILRLGPNAIRTKAAADDAIAILKEHRWLDESPDRPRSFTVKREG
jgi:Protein of unknown function (DUF3987)